MKLLDKYIFKQTILAALFGILIVIIVWISPEILFKIIKRAINGEITSIIAFKLFFLHIPDILSKAIPVGLMLGSLFVFDRLSRDSELVIFRGAGASFFRLMVPVFILGIIGYIACFITMDTLIPRSLLDIKAIKNEISQNYFVYVDKSNTDKPRNILIIGNYDGKNCTNIKYLKFSDIISSDTPVIKSIITADKAKWVKDHWLLINGLEYHIAPDGVYKNIIKFKSQNELSGKSAEKSYKLLINSNKRPSEMNIKQIKYHLNLLKSTGMNDEFKYMSTKLYQRYSLPFSCVIFALCGVILGYNKPREKRLLGFTIGVALIFIYYIISPFLDMLAQNAILLPVISAWFPNFIVITTMIVLIKLKQI
ncbi:MAG: LptF/LptG family permease [Candidatus Gastranaerophilales bacterium]|nr:LptF/LptG family permease [Candidatus Gastranaerophilales bacterium]